MNIPKHLGIILDGNRRFAEKIKIPSTEAHRQGAEKATEVLQWCKELGIKTVTLWVFSTENFNRPKDELNVIFNLLKEYGKQFAESKDTHENKIKLTIIGDLYKFPEDVKSAVKEAVEATQNYDDYHLNLALAYGGRKEILTGIKEMAKLIEEGKIRAEDIDEELIGSHLYSGQIPDVDLIIRTSGEQRTSGFLMWKSDYAEYYFSSKYWPEFDKEELLKAIISYNERKRRFGK